MLLKKSSGKWLIFGGFDGVTGLASVMFSIWSV